MRTEQSIPITSEIVPATTVHDLRPSLCWRAIIGGTVAAIGIHILLTALGVGAGLATFTPMMDTNPVNNFSVGTAVVWSMCALLALCFGGFVAGRFSQSLHSGFVHGILVWSSTLIVTLLLLSMGTGMILGGALKVLGEGLGIGAKTVASGVDAVANEGLKRSDDQLVSFIDEGVQSGLNNASPRVATRAKREIGFAVTKLFTPGNDPSSSTYRAAAIKALTQYSSLSEADAANIVTGWTTSYKNLQAELERLKTEAVQKAREAADRAAHNVSIAAIWSFFALLIGLLLSAMCGSVGARLNLRSIASPSSGHEVLGRYASKAA